MKGDSHSRLIQNMAGIHPHIASFQFPSWRIDQDNRARCAGGSDFCGYFPAFADVVQDNSELKLL